MENTPLPASSENVPEQRKEVTMKFGKEVLIIASAILLGSLLISGSILSMNRGGVVPVKTGVGTDTAVAPTPTDPTDTNATANIDDDALLGSKGKAKVAIIEFSDLECPFCKRFHADTFDTLVKDYVDTGKAILVARDFPLSFHDPVASTEAAVAECVRKEKGDAAYFSFTKGVYQNTVANGKGLAAGKLDELVRTVGANPTKVNACAETDAIKQEIAKDIADGQKAGISGTPSFIIGTLDADGNVTGERIVGALPIDGFKATIEKYLAQ